MPWRKEASHHQGGALPRRRHTHHTASGSNCHLPHTTHTTACGAWDWQIREVRSGYTGSNKLGPRFSPQQDGGRPGASRTEKFGARVFTARAIRLTNSDLNEKIRWEIPGGSGRLKSNQWRQGLSMPSSSGIYAAVFLNSPGTTASISSTGPAPYKLNPLYASPTTLAFRCLVTFLPLRWRRHLDIPGGMTQPHLSQVALPQLQGEGAL